MQKKRFSYGCFNNNRNFKKWNISPRRIAKLASQSIFLYFSACRQEEDRQYDIYLFMNETRSFFYDKNWFLTDFYITPGSSYSIFTSAYLSTLCALQDLVKAGKGNGHFNANLHELKLSDMEKCGYSYAGYCDYAGSSTRLNNLSREDYILIAYCLRNYTLEKIAELENISLSKVKRKLVALYKKVGVKGKTELCSAYSVFINKPGQ